MMMQNYHKYFSLWLFILKSVKTLFYAKVK